MQPNAKQHATALDANHPPLHYPLYRAVWIATLIANICLWMQNVGSAWLMVQLDPSPLMVALVQTAITLPAFLLGLPAGVYADLFDRRKMLITTHAWMLLATVILYGLLVSNQLSPWILLVLTFALGIGSAVSIPAWQASTSDTVPRTVLSAAINLNAIAYNGARAVGPALAGVVIAYAGMQWVFALNTVLLVLVLGIFIFAYHPPAFTPAPTEPLYPAMRTGVRYVRHAKLLHGHILRTAYFVMCASSLWALLPLVAGNSDVGGYGLLLGSLGVGAVLGGLLLNHIRPRIKNYLKLVNCAIALFLAAMLISAWMPSIYIISATLVLAGSGWIAFNSTCSAAFQTSLPAWVRARALAVFMLTFQGVMALGGALWGVVANYIDVSWTLTFAACLIILGMFITNRYSLRMGDESEVTLSGHWADPHFEKPPAAKGGRVAVQIDYHVRPEFHSDFTHNILALGRIRKRDGANHWMLYQDLNDLDRFSERFTVSSWDEHLRQRHRSTLADQQKEQALTTYLKPDSSSSVSYHVLITSPVKDRA